MPAVPVVDSVEVSAVESAQADFEVGFGDLTTDAPVMAMFALPGERVPITVTRPAPEIDSASASDAYRLEAASGTVSPDGPNRWTWTAPAQPGLHPIRVTDPYDGDTVTLNVFVMVPYDAMRRGTLNGYRIGAYPLPRRGHEEAYQRPRGFIPVTESVLDAQVSPHFKLRQFLCRQSGSYPQYLVLRQPLLAKLEELLAAVNDRGIEAPTFSIMSAYRTPNYNAAIGNVTTFSRHEYGDAADVFVDEDHDGVMDDLNHDGRHTIADARVLAGIVRGVEREPEHEKLVGGVGTYGPATGHGPFMHVDVRGFHAEWSS